jgi:hypothetical protein
LPPATGAAYCTLAPVPITVPALALHVTASFTPPVTLATSMTVSPAPMVLVDGATAIVTGVTVIVAVALLLASAELVAVIV